MEFRVLKPEDAKQFCDLIVDMYGHLESLEWFSPMPTDFENVKGIIENPRFYVLGAFDGDFLCGVTSMDYKCGKLIGKIDFGKEIDFTKLVEFGFTMVHSRYRGNGIMKKMLAVLIDAAKEKGFEWAFGKVHKQNFASSTSMSRMGFEKTADYDKPVKISDINDILSKNILFKRAEYDIKKKLEKNENAEFLYVDYQIMMKKL